MYMTDINEIIAKQEVILQKLTEITDDHEQRIRSLEKWLFWATGAVAVISFLFNIFKK